MSLIEILRFIYEKNKYDQYECEVSQKEIHISYKDWIGVGIFISYEDGIGVGNLYVYNLT